MRFVKEEPRIYTIDGEEFVSVTSVTHTMSGLEWQGPMDHWKIGHHDYADYREDLENSQQRGKEVHRICAAILESRSYRIRDKNLKPFIEAFKKWVNDYGDFLTNITASHCVDIKTSKKCPSKPWAQHAIQATAYMRAVRYTQDIPSIQYTIPILLERRVYNKRAGGHGYAGRADILLLPPNYGIKRQYAWIVYLDMTGKYRFFKIENTRLCYSIFIRQLKQFHLWQRLKK